VTQTAVRLARRSTERVAADASRVITQLFVPGQEGFDQQQSRTSEVLDRVLALDDDEATRAYDDVLTRFAGRHRHLIETFNRHADELADRLDPDCEISPTRRLLIGATFTSEYALEGAALCNPSMVPHPDQEGVPKGCLRVVMSVRAIGEGHRSSIGFRTGIVDAEGDVSFDPKPSFATSGQREFATFDVAVFKEELQRLQGSGADADYVFRPLGKQFGVAELEHRLTKLEGQLATRRQARRISALIRGIAERTYAIRFDVDTPLSERVLLPAMGAESKGMEDARFVRFTEEDGAVTYFGTYTAYDGTDIAEQVLETTDFCTFVSAPVVGRAAANKGLALFPRRIGGRFAALSRSDRESNAIAYSDNLHRWTDKHPCQVPARAWELLQLGNCGSPIETQAGWLVITHGVGPMRTYNIGAILLNLEDPTRVVGQLREPLLSPSADEQDGYVPNVVYSCGALVHAGTLVLPYGIGDAAISLATVPLDELLTLLVASPPSP
jgi:predicted GH43/DUF377 family glycosyl hydrolase